MSDQTEKNFKESEQETLSAISYAPHIKTTDSVKLIMWTAAAALFPSAVYAGYIFGLKAVVIMAASVASAVTAEALIQVLLKRPVTISDGSAFVTGLLFAMIIPPDAPVLMPVIGSFFAIIIVKQLFGGLGLNIFNPALAARAVMMLFWPVYIITNWGKFDWKNIFSSDIKNSIGIAQPVMDALAQAAPLTVLKEGQKLFLDSNLQIEQLHNIFFGTGMLKSFLFGNVGGGIGEVSLFYILIGGIVLISRKIISWHLPVVYIGTVGIISYIYYAIIGNPFTLINTLSSILSGGLFLGAFFMAADPVTTPITRNGRLIFTAGCGLLTFIFTIYSGYTYGFVLAILIMNSFVPLIDRYVKPKVFGREKLK